MYAIYEYVGLDLTYFPRVCVRHFAEFAEAQSYVIHPMNSRRVLTIVWESDKVNV
jgi:hypothetical protein